MFKNVERCGARQRSTIVVLALGVLVVARAANAQVVRAPEESVPRAGQSDGVSLKALLALAGQRAPAVELARVREGAARRARSAVPSALHDPTLGIEVGPRFTRSGGQTDYDLGLSLAQPLEIAGERGLRTEVAGRRAERARAESSLARWQIRRELVLAYRGAQVAQERLRLGARIIAFADAMARVAERRRAGGESSSIEVRIAQADALAARREHSLWQQQFEVARVRLAQLSGWPGELPARLSDALGEPPSVPALEPLLKILPGHPELSAQRGRVGEARAEVRLRERESWPVPVFGAEVVREGSVGGEPEYLVLGSLSLPLPLFRANTQERARAESEEQVQRAELGAASSELRARVSSAHAELSGARERFELMTRAAASFEDGLELLERGFAAGELELIEVTVLRERWFSALTGALDARLECEIAFAELEAAAGVPLDGSRGVRGARP